MKHSKALVQFLEMVGIMVGVCAAFIIGAILFDKVALSAFN